MADPAELLSNLNVLVFQEPKLDYPSEPPYHPSTSYPEYAIHDIAKGNNGVYAAVRNTLILLGLDKGSLGTSKWNPLKDIIKPGETVVIKPNFVLSFHANGGELFSIITHPSVIRPLVDYAYIALQGKGRILIADAPQMDCNFDELLEKTQLKSILELYKRALGFNIEIYDLRNFWLDNKGDYTASYSGNRHKLNGDPTGSVLVNLGGNSLFYGLDNHNLYGADFNRNETQRHHYGSIQEYLVSKTILSADVVITVPKLKVHKKIGVTLNLKGMVGINTNKNYLVHYKLGSPSKGGDQFPDGVLSPKAKTAVKLQRLGFDVFLSKHNRIADFLYNLSVKIGKYLLRPRKDSDRIIVDCGDWYGNDSTWRMVADLLRIFIYADKGGILQDKPARRTFCLVDGVIGGEGEGPLTPDSRNCGLIVAGFNPCAVDLVCTRLMGFDYKKMNLFTHVLSNPDQFKVDLSKIVINSNGAFTNLFDPSNKNKYFNFVPPIGWKGNIEIEETERKS